MRSPTAAIAFTLASSFTFAAALPAQQDPPHVVFLVGESEYGSRDTVPQFAARLEEELALRVTVLHSEGKRLPDLTVMDSADLLVLFLRFRTASDEQFARLRDWFDAGKPCVALRTTSHAFAADKGWFPPFFGGHYKAHAPNGQGTRSFVLPAAAAHPIVRGLQISTAMGHGGTYNSQPLADTATPLLLGRTGHLPSEPIAWIHRYAPGSRIFYTSLGSRENFAQRDFQKLLGNAVLWCLQREVPDGGAFEPAFEPAFDSASDAGEPTAVPAPPTNQAPEGATVLFDGRSAARWRHWDPGKAPLAIGIDRRADSSSGGEHHDAARWTIDNGALIARPGFGDVLTRESFGDYHLHVDFLVPDERTLAPDAFRGQSGIYLAGRYEIQIADSFGKASDEFSCGAIYGKKAPDENAAGPPNTWQSLDIHYRHLQDQAPIVSAWLNGRRIHDRVQLHDRTIYGFLDAEPNARSPSDDAGLRYRRAADESFRFGTGEFTIAARFRTMGNGTLAAKSPPAGDWQPDAKALFLRGGRLVYDIGWVGQMQSKRRYDDGKWHRVLLTHEATEARMFVDGALVASRKDFVATDADGHVFKIGAASRNFGFAYEGELSDVTVFEHNVTPDKARQWTRGEVVHLGDPALEWQPEARVAENTDTSQRDERIVVEGSIRLQADSSPVRFANVWLQPLAPVDHRGLIAALDDPEHGARALARGAKLYEALCSTCHRQPADFANGLNHGSDPLSLYQTLESGLPGKQPMAWIPPGPRYDIIHYLRTELALPTASAEYLRALPPGMPAQPSRDVMDDATWPPYRRMDHGNALHWTYEVAENNIAQKAIAVRLDPGDGGISRGNAFMVYDHDTMRVAAAWTGDGFIDWQGVAFDASHNSHVHLAGEVAFVNPVGPGWAHPDTGSFADPRFLGRDGKPYGPLPRDWLRYLGRHQHGRRTILEYTVGEARVLDSPRYLDDLQPTFERQLEVGAATHPVTMRIAPATTSIALVDLEGPQARTAVEDGFHVLHIAARDATVRCRVLMTTGDQRILRIQAASASPQSPPLGSLLAGGPPSWSASVTTQVRVGQAEGPFTVDTFPLPDTDQNPWRSWMRLGGFDFFADGRRAAISTWNGDVWLVDGLADGQTELRFRRIAAGLHQPLGVKILDDVVYVGCRDQICVLEDRNGDGETDFYRCFNNDHQVTEHFHEFAMGLQADGEGNFYYAKSARHALPALVPHHGTLLEVSADGSTTEIVANGFRAANGVCINDDGSFYVTDQEGHWTPKNRINRVVRGGFYGNMMGYHDRTSTKDEDMRQPLCWITNAFDRSPAELVRVRGEQWGLPAGSLLQVSYGMGRVFLVLEDQVDGVHQGGMTALPIEPFPTGVMRGRFHPHSGQLYCCGLFGWSGARTRPGGFYRVRYTGGEVPMPTAMHVVAGGIDLTFGCALDRETAEDPDSYGIETWQLQRSKSYGSKHLDTKSLAVATARLQADGHTVRLQIPNLEPTMCIEIRCNLATLDEGTLRPIIHGTIHAVK